VPLVVGLVETPETDAEIAALARHGVVAWVESSGPVREIGLQVPPDALDGVRGVLADSQRLVFAELQGGARLRNDRSAWRCQSGEPGSMPVFDRGLHGEGQVIGIMDTGIDPDHCHFDDPAVGLPTINDDEGTEVGLEHRKVRAVNFWWDADGPPPGDADWDDQGHGTHVAGSAAGDDGGDGVHGGFDGMAPAATLVIQDGGFRIDDCGDLPGLGCPMRPLGPMLAQAWSQGARIHTNSWGDEENIAPFNRYTERTGDLDRFVWEHPDILVLVAAGNAGPFDDSVGSPSTGKNLLAVGALEVADAEPPCPASFSSRGWTHDGRIKPDLLAPGRQVRSAATDFTVGSPHCGDRFGSGTSMASPTAAGLAALVRQYFTEGWYPAGVADPARVFEPSAALLRATMIASTVDVTTFGCSSVRPVPSRDQGWGLVQLDRALRFPDDDHGLVVEDRGDGFTTSSDRPVSLGVVVPDGGELKVVLVWSDPPSTSTAAVNLVNDLDLVVEGPTGSYRGNAFVDGVSVTGGEADRLNNVEVVWLRNATPGVWRVRVMPHRIQLGPQPWALVAVGDVEELRPRRAEGRRAPTP
jgi:subtilisin family serine protease